MHILETNLKFPSISLLLEGQDMKSDSDNLKNPGYFLSFYEAMREKELKKLRIAKCPACNKSTVYRLSSLGEAELHCKSCKALIEVERFKDKPPR